MIRRAFTIVEVMAALALLVLLMGAIMSFTWNVSDRRTRVVEAAASTRGVLDLLDRMEADLTTAMAAHPGTGAGISGDNSSVRVVFRSVWLTGPGSPEQPGDLQGAAYRFVEESGRIEGERFQGTAQGVVGELCAGIASMSIRYFDGREWRESYDSVAQRCMPLALEIEIGLTGADGASWRRIVRVPDARAGDGA